jgi:hypothetical protein
VLAATSKHAIPELWFTRLKFSEGSLIGGRGRRETGFELQGRLKAGRKEQSLAKLMEFIGVLREDPVFSESFTEVQLLDSRWKQTTNDEYLEFEIFCPLGDE